MTDITELKNMERNLQQHSEHLEELVKEKTEELTKAERMAGIGETAGMIGHDIRNPLQAITSAVYLAKQEIGTLPNNESRRNLFESISLIEQQTDYISKIVADLQDYAKKLCPEIKAYNLQDMIKEILLMVKIPENIQVIFPNPAGTAKNRIRLILPETHSHKPLNQQYPSNAQRRKNRYFSHGNRRKNNVKHT